MNQQKSIQEHRIAACEYAAQAYLFSNHPGAKQYSNEASLAARCAMRARTPEQAKRYADRAAQMAARAKLIAGEQPRRPWHQVQAEAQELYR